MVSMNLNDIAILNIRSVDYRCIFNEICKMENLHLLQKTHLTKKAEHYQIKKLMGKKYSTW